MTQAPEAVAVVAAARGVLVEQPLHLGRAQLAALPHALVQQHVGGEPAQLAAEPVGERDAEAPSCPGSTTSPGSASAYARRRAIFPRGRAP